MKKPSENSTFSERMKYFMKNKKITAENIAEKLGITKGAVTHWSNGIRSPKADTIEEIAEALNENIIDFFPNSKKNREEITKDELKNNLESYLPILPKELIPHTIKQLKVTKGYPTGAERIVQEDSMHYVTKIFIDKRMVATAYQDKELEAVVMIGDSMSPYLENDDIAIYHPTSKPLGDGRYVVNTPTGLTVKKLKFMSSGSILLISENSSYNTHGTYDEEFTPDIVDTLEIYGLVIGRILKS